MSSKLSIVINITTGLEFSYIVEISLYSVTSIKCTMESSEE